MCVYLKIIPDENIWVMYFNLYGVFVFEEVIYQIVM